MSKLTQSISKEKPKKPRKDFPLFPHATGRWAKKVRGKLKYFGKVETDPKGKAALDRWLDERDELLAGRTPKPKREGLTIQALLNLFIAAKENREAAGEITLRTLRDYEATARRIEKTFRPNRLVDDLTSADFQVYRAKIAASWGPVPLSNEIQRVRSVFKFGYENGLLEKPVRFGTEFRKPNAGVLRRARAAKGLMMFEPKQLQKLLKKAGVQLKAMILLGINCGFGNADCGALPRKALDLKKGWLSFPRPKTGVDRRCPLWPETLGALKVALAKRPKPNDPKDQRLFFITKQHSPWGKSTTDNPVSKEFAKLLAVCKLTRNGLGFYSLRRTFETIAGDSRDQVAVDFIMGHAPAANDMAAIYRQRIDDERLRAVVFYVREWLFGQETTSARAASKPR